MSAASGPAQTLRRRLAGDLPRMSPASWLLRSLPLVALWLAAWPLAAADPAAEINLLTGRGTAASEADLVRGLQKGDLVYAGDVISTGPNSYLNLKFTDGGFKLMRPNSRFVLEGYVFEQEGAPPRAQAIRPSVPLVTPDLSGRATATSRAAFRLLKGGFRAVTGLIGKINRDQYQVTTPVATIGIRGTDYTTVICDLACSEDPVLRQELSDARLAEGGLVAGVIDGRISVQSKGKHCDRSSDPLNPCELGPNQYMVVTRDGDQIRLSQPPRFLTVDPTPNPLTCAP